MNICLQKKPKNPLSKWLIDKGFSQLVNHATHIQGGHIDHAYWLDIGKKWKEPHIEFYSPYYSDHDCLLLTFSRS